MMTISRFRFFNTSTTVRFYNFKILDFIISHISYEYAIVLLYFSVCAQALHFSGLVFLSLNEVMCNPNPSSYEPPAAFLAREPAWH